VDDIVYDLVFFIYVILSLRLVVCAYMCAILLVVDNLRYSWKRFHSSWVSTGHRHVPVLRILGSGAWHDFAGIRARFSKVICHIYTIKLHIW